VLKTAKVPINSTLTLFLGRDVHGIRRAVDSLSTQIDSRTAGSNSSCSTLSSTSSPCSSSPFSMHRRISRATRAPARVGVCGPVSQRSAFFGRGDAHCFPASARFGRKTVGFMVRSKFQVGHQLTGAKQNVKLLTCSVRRRWCCVRTLELPGSSRVLAWRLPLWPITTSPLDRRRYCCPRARLSARDH